LGAVELRRRVELGPNNSFVFSFRLKLDPMTRMNYVQIFHNQRPIGHFDFNMDHSFMSVRYGTWETSEDYSSAQGSYSEWSTSCLKGPAIEVEQEYRERYRGLGSAMVTFALNWGRQEGLLGMRILDPRTPDFWKKLGFTPEGKDLVFDFSTHRIPPYKIEIS